jgi:hypothetical protein
MNELPIAVATGVFTVIVTMELKRRENDKKVAALIETMREMMQILTKWVILSFYFG